jgi:site-specific DNA-methyltransferase (adenine-specific)
MFPAKVVHYFVQRYSRPGDLVLDPFSGRGTVALQARIEGRRTVSNDLNPLAYVLTKAKSAPPAWSDIQAFLTGLERIYRTSGAADPDVPDDIRMLFHPATLRQLCFLRDGLLRTPLSQWTQQELMLPGALSGILHGAHRRDGFSRYLSISMPNTFSMSPGYVRKFIKIED